MATFLSITNDTLIECGVTTSNLSTLVGVTGKTLQVKNWVNRAWGDIQRKHHDWQWMRKSFSFATVANKRGYTPAEAGVTDLGRWMPETFRSHVTSLGYTTELWLGEWDYKDFRNLYIFGAQRTVAARPVVFAIAPDRSIQVGPLPNATGYTVAGDYYSCASSLVNDADVPGLPAEYADIIMHRAKWYYGVEVGAIEVVQSALSDYARLLEELEGNQLDDVDFGASLA